MPRFLLAAALLVLLLAGCARDDRRHRILISIAEQEMLLLRDGIPLARYPVSTSKFGVGSETGSYRTPVGEFRICQKIGEDLPPGAVLKSRRPTGEVLAVDSPGRDPIVTRILWLEGLESGNRNSKERNIYIHGTPEERNIGRPVSFGCVRMRSDDIVELYETVGKGARTRIMTSPLPPEFRSGKSPETVEW